MDHLKRLAVFAAVVSHGSMSAAARALGMSTSAVSQQVRALEQQSGVTLLHRSTRKLGTTDAGARVAAHASALTEAAAAAQRELSAAHDAPSGELRVSAPVGFARFVAPALAPLLAAHPALSLRLLVDDAMIDLIDARVDLALRAGRLADSNWAARRLGAFDWLLCASPAWVQRHGAPRRPADLQQAQWVALNREGKALRVRFASPEGEEEILQVEARVTSNNQLTLQQVCVAGLGVAMLTAPDAHEDIAQGRLVPLLPAWRLEAIPVWAVTPQRANQPAKVRHAIAALEAHLRTLPGCQA